MSLTFILEIYLRFKGRKGWKLNHFRFWKIKKGERQDKDITRLGDDKWHYRVRKKARKHGKWGLKQDSSSCTKIKNSKSGGNMYSEFEEKFGVFSEFYFVHTIYHFESWEVRSPTLQTVCKSELKWRSYDNLNTTAQSWRVISKWFRNPTYEFEI